MVRRRAIFGTVAAAAAVAAGAVAYAVWAGGDIEQDAASADPDTRAAAAEKLAGRTDEAGLGILHRLSRDENVRVAVEATAAIGAGRHRRCRELLARIAREARAGPVRGAAAEWLGKQPGADPEPLVAVLTTDRSPEARAGAARGLADLKSREAIPQLVAALDDADRDVRLWAINALNETVGRGIRFHYRAQATGAERQEMIAGIKKLLRRWRLLDGG